MSELRRALEFLTRADHGGTRREPFAYGTAFFDDRVPRRWDSNYLLVEHLSEAAGAADLAGEAERIQGSADLRHRKVEVRDAAVGARLEPGFRGLGWTGGTAQIEDVATLESHRGRGFASAVVLRAAAEARLAGADLIFLVADDEDWPKHLYRRLGFHRLGCVYEFRMAQA